MKKAQLVRIWKQLDGAEEALEKLMYDDEFESSEGDGVIASDLNDIKNRVEEAIHRKSRKPMELQ